MGQYHLACVFSDAGGDSPAMRWYSPHDMGNGLKLMEHSWIGNRFPNSVLDVMAEVTGRHGEVEAVWLGDYATEDDRDCDMHRFAVNAAWSRFGEPLHGRLPYHTTHPGRHDTYRVVDLDRGEYIDVPDDSEGWIVNPVPLLLCVGNGRGGGDYTGPDPHGLIGKWAYDRLTVTRYNCWAPVPEGPADMERIDPGFVGDD